MCVLCVVCCMCVVLLLLSNFVCVAAIDLPSVLECVGKSSDS